MDKNMVSGALGAFFMLAFYLICFVLWCFNIFKIIKTDDPTMTFEFVLRVLGVLLAPLGVIMGLI